MLLAIAPAFAPFAIPAGDASAAVTGHHEALSKAGHCDEQPAPDEQDKHQDKPCRAAGCMAAAMLPAMGEEALLQLLFANERPGLDRFYRGYLGEIATPLPDFREIERIQIKSISRRQIMKMLIGAIALALAGGRP